MNNNKFASKIIKVTLSLAQQKNLRWIKLSQICLIMAGFDNSLLIRYIRSSVPLADDAVFEIRELHRQ